MSVCVCVFLCLCVGMCVSVKCVCMNVCLCRRVCVPMCESEGVFLCVRNYQNLSESVCHGLFIAFMNECTCTYTIDMLICIV